MAIEKMKFVSASTDDSHRDAMLLAGMKSGLLHAEEADDIVNDENEGKLLSEENPWSGHVQTLKNFAHATGFELKEKEQADTEYTLEDTAAFLKKLDEKFGVTADSEKVVLTPDDEKALDALSVIGFEDMHACRYLDFGFGRIPKESYKKLAMYRDEIFGFHKLHETQQYVWMIIVTSDSYQERIHKIFQDLYFEEMEIPDVDVHRLLKEYGDQINDVYTWALQRSEIHDLYSYVAQIDGKNMLSGFVRAADTKAYEEAFKGLPVTFEEKNPEEVPSLICPTVLKNNWFARPFELFLGMYGVPKYGDFDPTPFLAFTYCLLFGIMFGDLGQGLVLFLIGMILEKKGKLFGIIGRVGITSMIFGFLFGSVFGYEDVLTPIHQSLFGVRGKLFDVMANSNTMVLLIGAILIGAVLILTTQAMNIVNRFKHGQKGEAIFSQNGIAGFVFYASILVAIAGQFLLKINLINPLYIIVFFVLPVVCFVMKEPFGAAVEGKPVKPKEGWGGYVTQSIFELIDVLLTFVTNTMSYLRVGGFVLSHAGMMLVVMTLVNMTGGAGPIVLIIGNIFVMVLEGLIVGIQALRLEYYEMFSRYYDAGGTPFKAFTAETAE
jgi:V/A-type H+-transporting ATPase subunit I